MGRYITKQNEYIYKNNPSNISEKGSNVEASSQKNHNNRDNRNMFLAEKTSLQSLLKSYDQVSLNEFSKKGETQDFGRKSNSNLVLNDYYNWSNVKNICSS